MQVTTVTPLAKVEPEAGTQVRLAPGQLSDTVMAKVTFEAMHWPGSVERTMFVEQPIEGGSVSLMVTVKLHVTLLLLLSVRRKLFVVVPLEKVEPLGSPAVWVSTAPGQLSVKLTL